MTRNGFQNIPLWGGQAMMQFTWPDGSVLHAISRIAALGTMAIALVILLMSISGAAWTRRRLWPQLGPGQYVGFASGVRA